MTLLAAAITPPGRGAIAIVHVCGAGAGALVARLFPKEIFDQPRHAILRLDGEVLDEVMVRKAPGFTGEETVEISCHGGVTVNRLLAVLKRLGVHCAAAEELLERGVETGHLDRIRAEALAFLPRALTDLAARVLLDQSEGALSRAVESMVRPSDAGRLLISAPLGLTLTSPSRVVLLGYPNVGKSTLFNALVERDRVIVSEEPGTTRDPVREVIAIDQVPLELVDTAGVGTPQDQVESLSIDRTRHVVREADAVLFLLDAETGPRRGEMELLASVDPRRTVVLLNKTDSGSKGRPDDGLPISAKTGRGLDAVRREMLKALQINPRSHSEGDPAVFTPRQERLLRQAHKGRLSIEAARGELLRGPANPSLRTPRSPAPNA